MLIGELLRRSAERVPSKTAIVFGDERISYAALDEAANRFAHALLQLGITHGGTLAILSWNRAEFAVALFGSARSGAVLAALSPRATPQELELALGRAEAELLLVESALLPAAEQALAALPRLRHVVILDAPAPAPGTVPLAALLVDRPPTEPDVAIAESDPFCVTFSGGTTGLPKGIVVSHRARVATALAAAVEFGLDERDVAVVATPLFHAAGLFVWFLPALTLGLTTVLLRTWDPESFLAAVERERATAAFLVPTQIADLLAHPQFDARRLASLRNLNHAGAPMPEALKERFAVALPHVAVNEHYGQSETGALTIRRSWHPAAKRGSVGRRIFNVDLRVVDAAGAPLPPGAIGEVVTRGDHLVSHYLGAPEETEAAFRLGDDWLWTGDLGFLDNDGFLTLVDRSKDVIIAGGETLYPSEIEGALSQHPSVADCAVFGIPDERWGELPAAHVVLAAGAAVSEEALIAFCTDRLARHKRPRLVKFVDALPRTTVGKVQRSLIRSPYWAGRGKKI